MEESAMAIELILILSRFLRGKGRFIDKYTKGGG
jgi:hypothetical protein